MGLAIAMMSTVLVITAQDTPADPCADIDAATALYQTFVDNYNKKPLTVADREKAVKAGKEFLEKYGNCEAWKDQSNFVKPWVPKLEDWLVKARLDEKLRPLYKKFDDGVQQKKWDDVFAAGKEIYALIPDKSLDQMIPMALIGVIEVGNKNNAYADESIKWAKLALEKINAGVESLNKSYGVYQLAVGNKENAISELNYALGVLYFYGKADRETGIKYFYQVTQLPGSKQEYSPLYVSIADYYRLTADKLGTEIINLINQQKAAATDEEKLKLDEQIKPKVGLYNGYLERALDALSRAVKFAKDNTPQAKAYKDSIYKDYLALYKRRFEKEEGADQWMATAVSKPLPDPTSQVQPVFDPEPTTTTTTTSTSVTKPSSSSSKTAKNLTSGNTAV